MNRASRLRSLSPLLLAGLVAASVAPNALQGQAVVAIAKTALLTNATERLRIEQAVPGQAIVRPVKPRRLLIFDGNVNYPGHASSQHASYAFTLMGEKTGAWQTVVTRDPAVFERESLKQFDAVFFNNNVGNLFTNATWRQNLVELVYGGGGLLGVHGTSVAFTRWPSNADDWPEFGLMLGGRGANHRDNTEQVFFKFDDPEHPLNRVFAGKTIDYRDEFFRVHEPYSRDRVRVLFSIDNEKTVTQGLARGKVLRADNDYALAWVRQYGRGRVFYCGFAHNPYLFWDPMLLEFYLGVVQFALGDLPAPTLPSGFLTSALRAQEKLGWRLGLEASSFPQATLFEVIDKNAELGLLRHLGGSRSQKVSPEIPKEFDARLSDAELKQIRLKLEAAGIRLLTYDVGQFPADAAGCRQLFEFGRKIGIETLVGEPLPATLDAIEKLCDAYDLKVAIPNHTLKDAPSPWTPQAIQQLCRNRNPRLGACADLGDWLRAGIDPLQALNTLQDRLIIVQIHDLNDLGPAGRDVRWGTGAGKTEAFLEALHQRGLKPTMFGLDYAGFETSWRRELARCIQFFNTLTLKLTKE